MPRRDRSDNHEPSVRLMVREVVTSEDWEGRLDELTVFPPARLIGPLTPYLLREPVLKWRAVTMLGITAARLAAENPEGGRTALRRFTWMLNDESGGIPWGAPEAIGEILSQSELLGKEFHHVLVSYVLEEADGMDNYLEFTPLRQGAWWGIGRLGQARPGLLVPAARRLLDRGAGETDTVITGLVCWIMGNIQYAAAREFLAKLADDRRQLELYRDRVLSAFTVGALAREALEKIERPHGRCLPETWG